MSMLYDILIWFLRGIKNTILAGGAMLTVLGLVAGPMVLADVTLNSNWLWLYAPHFIALLAASGYE